MKIIDLLNKIANDEELPEIIKVMGGTYYLCRGDLSGSYYFSEKQGLGGVKLKFDTSVMNEEVEISESVEEIYKRHIDYIYGEEDKKIEPLILKNFTSNQKNIARKVNEIIDYINKGD